MKKFTLLILILISVNFVNAQRTKQVAWVSKFAVAGGINSVYLFPQFGEINNQIKSFGIGEFTDNGLFTIGGSGFIYIKIVDNVRLGGIGFGTSTSKNSVINGHNREVNYNIGIGALTVEYSIPSIKKVALSIGFMAGVGSQQIELFQNNGSFDWNNLITDFENPTNSFSRIIKNDFFTFAPTINLDVPFNRFMALRIGTGYLFTVGNKWEIENNIEISNVPSALNFNSFFIQAGVYFGLFLF